jgi:CRP/FNR family transcriptional regulator
MTISDSDFAHLQTMYPALADLSPALTATVRQQARPFEAPVGAVVFEQDGPCSMFILLLGGEVDVSRPSASGREILLYRLRPGDTCVLTVNCLLRESAYPARAVVRQPIHGYLCPQPVFQQLLDASPRFRAAVLRLFSERLARLMALVEGVAFEPVEQRLARTLVEQGPRVTLTHQALADQIGTAREVVSRHLKGLAAAGAVRLSRGQIVVRRPDLLHAIAEPLGSF